MHQTAKRLSPWVFFKVLSDNATLNFYEMRREFLRSREPSPDSAGEEGSMSPIEIANNFTYHAPTAEQASRYAILRAKARELAMLINEVTPSSREQSLALTNLEQAVFWANASIARNEASAADLATGT